MPRHLFIVTGPAGCGKSTVARYLATQFDFPFIEGDEFHSKANVAKMSAKIPLNDGDRWDWLQTLRQESVKKLEAGASGVIVTCSALKQKYRDVIRIASYNDHNVHVHFIYLQISQEESLARVQARSAKTDHFMGFEMVKSQFDDLEEPNESEERDVLSIDVSGTPAEVEDQACEVVASVIALDSNESSP